MSVDGEISKLESLKVEYMQLLSELASLESSIDYTSIDNKKSELKAKVDSLKVPVAAKQYKLLLDKHKKMGNEDTYESRYVKSHLYKNQEILIAAGVITERVI